MFSDCLVFGLRYMRAGLADRPAAHVPGQDTAACMRAHAHNSVVAGAGHHEDDTGSVPHDITRYSGCTDHLGYDFQEMG